MPSERLSLQVTPRQRAFIDAPEREVLFGGAAGGGKSFGQLIDAFLYALRYPRSKQLILRRTYPELEKSLIRVAQTLFPRSVYTYNGSSHVGRFKNGSLIDFGYSATESDVFQYQSAEYDVIRFDELTHFTEFQYVYMLSRLRGVNGYPKQIKASTNPGGIGHAWVKERFIDPSPPDTPFRGEDGGSRIFLPSKIDDNPFLVRADPEYRERLLALPEAERRALLYGDWNLLEGRFFREFRYDLHTVDGFPIPAHWRKYRTLDYGLDRLACLWAALDPDGNVWIYREVCRSDLIISDAARAILGGGGRGGLRDPRAPGPVRQEPGVGALARPALCRVRRPADQDRERSGDRVACGQGTVESGRGPSAEAPDLPELYRTHPVSVLDRVRSGATGRRAERTAPPYPRARRAPGVRDLLRAPRPALRGEIDRGLDARPVGRLRTRRPRGAGIPAPSVRRTRLIPKRRKRFEN